MNEEQQAKKAAAEVVRIYRHSRFLLSTEFLDDLQAELTRLGKLAYARGVEDAINKVVESFHWHKRHDRQAEFDEVDIRHSIKGPQEHPPHNK